MKREGLIRQMAEEKRPWDLLIIGGADGGNDGSQSVCIPDGAPGGKFVCI